MFAQSLRSTSRLSSALKISTIVRTKFTLPDLPYDYNELEPFISAEIMQLHHSKHHQAYITNLNIAVEKNEEARFKKDVVGEVALQGALKFNGGGHINHSLIDFGFNDLNSIFWTNLAPPKKDGGGEPTGELLKAIEAEFGSFEKFVSTFNTKAAAVQGSGWGWLGKNKATKRLEIITTPNQDPLTDHIPLLGIDVWEHAYYLQYKNVRPDYLKAVWNVVNWKNVAERYSA